MQYNIETFLREVNELGIELTAAEKSAIRDRLLAETRGETVALTPPQKPLPTA